MFRPGKQPWKRKTGAPNVQVAPFCRALSHHFRQQIFGEYSSIHRIFATKTAAAVARSAKTCSEAKVKLLRQIRFTVNVQLSRISRKGAKMRRFANNPTPNSSGKPLRIWVIFSDKTVPQNVLFPPKNPTRGGQDFRIFGTGYQLHN